MRGQKVGVVRGADLRKVKGREGRGSIKVWVSSYGEVSGGEVRVRGGVVGVQRVWGVGKERGEVREGELWEGRVSIRKKVVGERMYERWRLEGLN